jgi:stage II sporulation protein GA (sporulation sigma-E factor processing peptidase)
MVYLDLLILANFLMDYSIISFTGQITKERMKFKRIILASLVAVSSLVLFSVSSQGLFLILRFSFSVLIVYVAFEWISLKKYLINLIIFYCLSYLLAGILISFNLSSNFMVINFFDLKIWALLLISFLIANSLTYILKVQLFQSNLYMPVKFKIADQDYQLFGFLDTGNDSTGSNQIPIVFVNQKYLKETINEAFLTEKQIPYQYSSFRTLNQQSNTLVFKPHSFQIMVHKHYMDYDVYLALVNGEGSSLNEVQVILNRNLLV